MAEKTGSGRRSRVLQAQLAAKGGVRNPAGLAAAIGRRKYGDKRFGQLAAAGRRRAAAALADPDEPPPRPRRIKV
jgi:hypothetical protein